MSDERVYSPLEHAAYIRRALESMPPSAFENIWAERELLLESLDVIENELPTSDPARGGFGG